MTLDWIHFTPWSSLAGGMLIGLAAALLILFNGRIAGISGILGGLLPTRGGGRHSLHQLYDPLRLHRNRLPSSVTARHHFPKRTDSALIQLLHSYLPKFFTATK